MISRGHLAEVFGTVVLGLAVAVAFGYVAAVLTWPSVRRVLNRGLRR
ncbi:hypothetical protein ACH35V_32840 [Actinomadura sp. 1N219]